MAVWSHVGNLAAACVQRALQCWQHSRRHRPSKALADCTTTSSTWLPVIGVGVAGIDFLFYTTPDCWLARLWYMSCCSCVVSLLYISSDECLAWLAMAHMHNRLSRKRHYKRIPRDKENGRGEYEASLWLLPYLQQLGRPVYSRDMCLPNALPSGGLACPVLPIRPLLLLDYRLWNI